MRRKRTKKEEAFILAALEGCSGAEAGRRAGYKNPRIEGWKVLRRLREDIEEARREAAARAKMSSDEVLEKLSVLARDPTHKDHFNAIKTWCVIHGLIDKAPAGAKEALDVKLDDELARFQKAIEEQTAQKVAAATNCNGAIPAN